MGFRDVLDNVLRDVLFLSSSIKTRVLYYMEDFKVFSGTMINMLLTFAGYFVLWSVILSNTSVFEGVYNRWDLGSIVMLIGFSELAFALDSLVTFGLSYIPRILHEEGLEIYSVHPVSTLVEILGKYSEPIDGFAGLFWSLVFILLSCCVYGVPLSLVGFIVGILSLLLGLIVISALYLLFASLSFRYGMLEAPIDFITMVYVSFSRVPHDVFPCSIRLFLTFVLPVALLSTFPTLLTSGVIDVIAFSRIFIGALLVTVVLVFVSYIVWSRGRAVYQPVGG